jgi:hypothetical protein
MRILAPTCLCVKMGRKGQAGLPAQAASTVGRYHVPSRLSTGISAEVALKDGKPQGPQLEMTCCPPQPRDRPSGGSGHRQATNDTDLVILRRAQDMLRASVKQSPRSKVETASSLALLAVTGWCVISHRVTPRAMDQLAMPRTLSFGKLVMCLVSFGMYTGLRWELVNLLRMRAERSYPCFP